MKECGTFNAIELFCGSATISAALKQFGFETWNTDIRKRKNICEPSLKIDILNLHRSLIPFDKIHVVWASVPCTDFSYGAGNFYYSQGKPKPSAEKYLVILKKCLDLIEEISPALYFIENPRGHLRYNKTMIDFLARNSGMVKYITLSSYGFHTTKPTDIFTNALDLCTKKPDKYGRGNKNKSGIELMDLTICQRQKTPQLLADEIAAYCFLKLRQL